MFFSNVTTNLTTISATSLPYSLAGSTSSSQLIYRASTNVTGLPVTETRPLSCAITQPLAVPANPGETLAPFSYYIPYDAPQACDIYGPTCQTGDITVRVSVSECQSSTTSLPCSSYLAAQAQYLDHFQYKIPPFYDKIPWDWQ